MKNFLNRLFRRPVVNEFKRNEYQRKREACLYMIAHYEQLVETDRHIGSDVLTRYDMEQVEKYQGELLLLEGKKLTLNI